MGRTQPWLKKKQEKKQQQQQQKCKVAAMSIIIFWRSVGSSYHINMHVVGDRLKPRNSVFPGFQIFTLLST